MCNLLRYKDRLQQAYAKFEFSEVRIEPKIRFKVAPSEPAPIITIQDDAARIGMMRFGLQPKAALRGNCDSNCRCPDTLIAAPFR